MVELWISEPDLRKNIGYSIFGGVIFGIGVPIIANAMSLGSAYIGLGGLLCFMLGIYLMRFGVLGIRDLWEVKLLKDKAPVPKKEKAFVAEKVA